MADPFDQQNKCATGTDTHSAPSSPASSRIISNGVTHTVSSNSGVSASGGIKVKIKRTGSTDSRQAGLPKADHHEIVHSPASKGGNGLQSSNQNGSKRSAISGPPGSGSVKKEKLKLTVTSAGTGDYSLSEKMGSLSSSLDSSPSTIVSSTASSGSGSSAASSPVIVPKDQPFISRPNDASPLKRQLTGGAPEPPSKKSKVNEEDTNSSQDQDDKPVNGMFMNGSSPEKENDASEVVRSADGRFTQAGTMTEPEILGPCEPGTIVKLNGVVVQEAEKGMLVLNVCWKGKTFMGALMNCSKSSEDHKWGPPKDPAIHKRKRGRGNRSRTPPVKIPISKKGKPNVLNGAKGGPGKERAQRLPRVNYGESDDEDLLKGIERSCGETKQSSPTSQYIECPKPHCSKKFPVLEALKYHLSSNHIDEDDIIKRKRKAKDQKAEKPAVPEESSKKAEEEKPVTDDEMKPTDLSFPAVNGTASPVKSRPPPPPTTSSIKPSPNIQGVNYLSSTTKRLDGPPTAHSNSLRPSVPQPLVHNGTYSTTTTSPSQPLALNSKPKASKPSGGPVSPAYSDISDEETPPVVIPPPSVSNVSAPGRLPSLPSGAGGLFNSIAGGPRPMVPKSSAGLNLASNSLDRKTDGSAPTTQTIGPPPQHLPPELHGGSLMFPPANSSVMNQYAAMFAAAAMGGQRLPMPSGLPGLPGAPVNSKKALDVMAQHANNYSATRKLQEMQESVKKPSLQPQQNRTPPPVSRPPSSSLTPSSQPPTSIFNRIASDPVATAASNLLRHEHNHTHLHLGYPPGFPPQVSSADLSSPVHGTPPRGPQLPPSALPPAAHGGAPHPSLIPGLFGSPNLQGFRLPANFPPK